MKIRAAALALCSLTHLASADDRTITLDRTCVEIDDAADKLAATDRDYALGMFRQVLERADLLVVSGGCTETYRLSHEQVEQQYVIHVASSAGKRRMTTTTLEDLSRKYGRLVHSLIDAKAAQVAAAAAPPPAHAPIATAAAAEPADGLESLPTADAMPSTTTTTPADTGEATDAPQHKDRVWYVLAGVNLGGGAALTGGFKRDLDSLTLDFSLAVRGGGDGGTAGLSAAAEILRSSWTTPTTQVYGGGGLSLGSADKGDQYSSSYYSGGGLQGELTAGLRMGGGGAQFVAQVDVTLPFYEISNSYGDTTYPAAGVISAGIGW